MAVDRDLGSDRNGASEPEESGEGQNSKADNGVVEASKDAWRDGNVEKDNQRPDAVEQHEVGGSVIVVEVGRDNYSISSQ